MQTKRVVITPGEPAGIGPDLVVQLAQNYWPVEVVVCADGTLLQDRAKMLRLPLTLLPYQPKQQPIPQSAGTLTLLSISLPVQARAGELNVNNSKYVIKTLSRTCNGCINREFSALITGPVHKGILNDAGIPFIGHTEFLASQSNIQKVVMMLVTEEMRIALVTTHLPIKSIPDAITPILLQEIIQILHDNLKTRFNIKNPKILVCGLNPHAGEGGYIGKEEIDIIIPVLKEMQKKGMNLTGPLPADTIFQPKYLKKADVVLAMYHDQGLPVIKYRGFGRAVNITLGLPFIRTSVDHGTAIDLAGKNQSNVGSFAAALNIAIKMVINTS